MDNDLTKRSYSALLYDTRREYRQVIAQLTRFLANNPNSVPALNNRAIAYLETGEAAQGRADLDAAVAVAAWDQMPFANRAKVRRDDGDLIGALDDLTRALEIDPARAFLHVQRSMVLIDLGRDRDALRDLDRAVDLGSTPKVLEERDRLRALLEG